MSDEPDRPAQIRLIECIDDAIELVIKEWNVTPVEVIGALEVVKADYLKMTQGDDYE